MNDRKNVYQTPYFTVWAVDAEGDESPFYAVQPADYVCVVAMTEGGEVLLVRQYRPVVGRTTLELPAGCVDPGEAPEEAARRELMEETGYEADEFVSLGTLMPDTGRLCNTQWCYFARNARRTAAEAETGIETLAVPHNELDRLVANGGLCAALHLATLHAARARRLLPL